MEWPPYDESLLVENIIKIVVQINGKKRGLIESKRDISENDLLEIIKKEKNLSKHIEAGKIIKKIYIPNKLINIII